MVMTAPKRHSNFTMPLKNHIVLLWRADGPLRRAAV
jgi:hypothetical protein